MWSVDSDREKYPIIWLIGFQLHLLKLQGKTKIYPARAYLLSITYFTILSRPYSQWTVYAQTSQPNYMKGQGSERLP